MKTFFLTLLLPNICISQIMFATFKDECIIWNDTYVGVKQLSISQLGDSCVIIKLIEPPSGSAWYKVITVDTVGYVLKSFIHLSDDNVRLLRSENTESEREREALKFMNENKKEWTTRTLNKAKANLAQKQKRLKDIKGVLSKYTALVTTYSTYPNSLDYPTFSATILNCSVKTIKYVWFNVTAYNAVHDKEGSATLKGVGPIKPFDDGEYAFSTIVYSRVVEYCKINSVRIQYMDGTTQMLNGKSLDTNLKSASDALQKLRDELPKEY